MTNNEMEKILSEMQSKHCAWNWKFKVKQTKHMIKIYWEYIDDEMDTAWTIQKDGLYVYNEYHEFISPELELTDTLEDVLSSVAYYMVTRY